MATTKFYLDTRGIKDNNPAPLKVSITKHGHAAYISLDIRIQKSQWDNKAQRVIDAPNKKVLNTYINSKKIQIDNALLEMLSKGELRQLTATQIKNKIIQHLDPEKNTENLFLYRFQKYRDGRTSQRTQEIYSTTLKKIIEYDSTANTLTFEQITKDWLVGFDNFLQKKGLKKNTRNLYLHNIRAVINDAIDNEITTHYPMRKLNLSFQETVKRSLTIDELRTLFMLNPCDWRQMYLDYFKLTFYLIGINPADLCTLTNQNLRNGRLVFNRKKTGRLYNIKVEPEAMNLINKYRGEKRLVNFAEKISNYRMFTSKANRALKKLGTVEMVMNASHSRCNKHNYTPLYPQLSIYWARHTWATIAFSIGIPDELIAAALGHSHGNRTTAIYIDKSIANIDAVNRKVLDYVKETPKNVPDS